MKVLPRPDYWQPGLPLPSLYPATVYTGSGAIGVGGKVTATREPVRWETQEEWRYRISDQSPKGTAPRGLDSEAARARAEGNAQTEAK